MNCLRNHRGLIVLTLAVVGLMGCANSDQRIGMETAKAIGTSSANVRVENVRRGATAVSWEAVDTRDGTRYVGEADDMMRSVNVTPVDQ